MQRALVRNSLGIIAALASFWLLDHLYSAVFLIHVYKPDPPLHAPPWLEPMEPVVRLLSDMIPAAVLGTLVTSRPWAWAAAVSLACFFAYPIFLGGNPDFYFSLEGFAHALKLAMIWAIAAMAARSVTESRRPNISAERTREI